MAALVPVAAPADRAPRGAGRLIWPVVCLALAAGACAGPPPEPAKKPDGADKPADKWARARQGMVDDDVVAAGIRDPRVIDAMRRVARHEFVPDDQREYAYFDMALPIGEGQTISSPFVVAYMTEKIDPQPTDRVLEIGTGSGYQAAVLSGLVADVYTIEIVEPLAERAAGTLRRLGFDNIHIRVGDGYQGWPEEAPFDKIVVTCSPEEVPTPLLEQLREGGRLVIPVGQRYQQTLYLYRKRHGKLEAEPLEPTMFVPMTGTAEALRSVEPDQARPALVNGGFEKSPAAGDLPPGWYYVRQARVEPDEDAPEGRQCLTMNNSVPGRSAQALQGFAIDGRRVRQLQAELWLKLHDVKPGRTPDEQPRLLIVFYDENRAPCGQHQSGDWPATLGWTQVQEQFPVPRAARLAVLAIGLMGAAGEASFDAVSVAPGAVNPSVLPP